MTIRTFFQDKPGGGGRWLVAAPGPGLDAYLDDLDAHLDAVPTIAVDGAGAHPTLQYDYLAAWDRPARVHDHVLERALELRPRIITQWTHARAWEDWAYENLGTPDRPADPVIVAEHPKKDPELPLLWRSHRLSQGPSWLLAIRYAFLRAYAKQIDLLGFDLAGEGYSCGLEDEKRRTPYEWEGKWRGERNILTRVLRLTKGHAKVKRWGPRPRWKVPKEEARDEFWA